MIALVLALAASNPSPTPWHFSIRADPIVFALLGVSVGVDAAPADSHWRYSLAAFHVEVPELLVPLVAQPSNGVSVVESAVQLGAFYDVGDDHDGLYLGPELYFYYLDYTVEGFPLDARELYAHVTVGYTWFPFKDAAPVYLQPWATLGVPVFHTGGVQSGNLVIEDRILNWHATVSLGARFL